MELLQLFDDKLNKLDEYIERDKKLTLKDNRYFMIILLYIQNDEGKFLVQKTSKEKGSIYAVTGGHVTYGDTDDITVIKEAKEEMNLTLEQDKLIKVDTLKYKHGFASIYYYHDNINLDNLTLQKEEVESIYWLTTDQIDSLFNLNQFRPSNKLSYDLIKEWLNIKNI